ncbi:PAC1 Nuclear distribution protein PAC1 [Candida maltosa Xu316]
MEKSQILTERQQTELNKAIIQYLQPLCQNDNHQIIDQLSSLLQTSEIDINGNSEIVDNYLEKKWSTVLRLQKKIIDLENEITNLNNIINTTNSDSNGIVLSKDKINWIPKGTVKQNFQCENIITTVKLHPNLPLILNGCNDGNLYIWNLSNDDNTIPEKMIKAHTRAINKICFSYTKPYYLATCSSDLTIKIWDDKFNHIRTLNGHEHTVSSIQFSPNDSNMLYSVSRDKNVRSFVGHSEWCRDLDTVSSESQGDFILTCSNDQSARLSHVNSGVGVVMFVGHTHVVETVKFLPKIQANEIIDEFITKNIDQFPSIPSELLKDPIYDQLGFKYCITGARDNTIKLWLIPPPTLVPHRSPLPSKYNNSQGWLIAELRGHQSWVKCLAVHPNGKFIISGSDDKTIKFWDLSSLLKTGSVSTIKTISGHEGFINDIDFARLQVADPDKNIETPEDYLKDVEKRMRCLFVSGSADNTVRLWN